MLKKIKESVTYIVSRTSVSPVTGIILGSGLGNFANEIEIVDKIPFDTIPHFPAAKVPGHEGVLLLGYLHSKPVVILQGRAHFYEGYSMNHITFPVRVMKFLGIENLLLTNAAGGLNPDFKVGDIMVITDHINMMPNPLIGENDHRLGPRFPDMSQAYDRSLIKLAHSVAEETGILLQEGIYIAVSGPVYETPAEYKFFRIIGGDAVGMSTVPEVIVARHMSIRCFALSVITDMGIPGNIEFLSHEKVTKAAMKTEPVVAAIVKGMVQQLS